MASEAVTHISKGNAVFSNKLYDIFSKKDGNIFYSPLSAHAILSLVYQGAGGETAKSLEKALGLPNSKTAAEGYQNLMEKLNSVEDVKLHIANKVFVHHERTLKPEFASIAKEQFLAEAESIAFTPDKAGAAGKINNWVEAKTNNKIKDLISPDDLDELTRLVLVNAIYFKGDWLNKFEPTLTKKEKFYLSETDTVDCDMMHINKKFFYAEDDSLDAQIVRLPYKNENLSLMIILPRSKTGIKDLEKRLLTKTFTDLQRQLRQVDVILSLPKFKIETTMDLNQPLDAMGLGVMFSNNAEFPNMLAEPEPLKVSKVIQKAFIEVNEEGAEAAAATGVRMALLTSAPRRQKIIFNANHPFIFSLDYGIGESFSLFIGKLSNPSE